jgi:hypothetical protein
MKILLAPTALTTGALLLLTFARSADAQPLGTFRWQLQPFCNVVTLTVVQIGDRYTLDGTDDQCGAPERVSVSGVAFLNPNGSIGFGLTLVAPGARSAHMSATISPVTLSGTWFDNLGQQGPYVFNPAAPTGPPRPTIASVRITVSHQNWFPVYESFNLTFTRFANRLAISRPAAGFVVVTAAPDLPVLDNGRRLRLISVQLCYDADATAELSGVEIIRTAHATNTLPYFSTIVDTTLRTDETCRNYVLPMPVLVGPNDAFNLIVHIHYVMAGATFSIGRTTFVFEPSFAEAQSLDGEPTDAPGVLAVGSGPAVRKEPPR